MCALSLSSASEAAKIENGGTADDNDAIAIGEGSSALKDFDVALGAGAVANGYMYYGSQVSAIAIGNDAQAIGGGFIAIGDGATATSENVDRLKIGNIAIGEGAKATGSSGSIAIGYKAEASSGQGNAFGIESQATGASSSAFGWQAWATANDATAVGVMSRATALRSTAIGPYAQATANYTTSLGYFARATDVRNISVGGYSEARGSGSIALGYEADAYGNYSLAIGTEAVSGLGKSEDGKWVSSAGYTLSVGNYAKARGDQGTAIGTSAKVEEGVSNSVALGYGSVAAEDNVVSVGTTRKGGSRRIVNLAAGIKDTDGVNVSQLKDLNGLLGGTTLTDGQWGEKFTVDGKEYDSVSDAIASLSSGPDGAVMYDADDKATVTLGGTGGTTITNLKAGSIAAGSMEAVNGGQLFTTNTNLSNLGDSVANVLGGGFSFEGGTLTGDFSVKIGDTTYTNISDALSALSEGWTFVPVDDTQTAGGGAGTGAGDGTTPPSSSTIQPGGKLTVNAGSNIDISGSDGEYTVSVSDNPGFGSVSVADGKVVADKDGVAVEGANGGSVKIDGDSVSVSDTVTISKDGMDMGGTKITNVADGTLEEGGKDAVNGGQLWETNQKVDKNTSTITEIGSVLGGAENGYKKPAFDTVTANDINVGKINISGSGINMGGADITTGGGNIDMGGGRITNVANGAVAQNSTDAVNGGQLWDAYQRIDAMGGDIYRRMDDLREDVNVVGAHAAALSGLHPIDYNPYEPTTLSAAIGTYRDEYAVAVGVFHYARENVMLNLGASLCSDGDIMGRAGVSFTLGKSSRQAEGCGDYERSAQSGQSLCRQSLTSSRQRRKRTRNCFAETKKL